MDDRIDAAAFLSEMDPLFHSDPGKAYERLQQRIAQVLSEGRKEMALMLYDEWAWQATSRSDMEEALPVVQSFLEMAEASGLADWEAKAQNTYGAYLANAGEPLAAVDRFSRALHLFEAMDQKERMAAVLANLGEMLIEMEDVERAGPYLEEAEHLTVATDRPELRVHRTYVLYEQGHVDEAWRRVVELWRSGKGQPQWLMRGYAHELAGWLRRRRGETSAAIRHTRRALALFASLREPFRVATLHVSLGEMLLSEFLETAAAEEFRLAAEIGGTLGYRQLEIKALRELLPITSGPMEGLAVQQRLVTAMRLADEQNRLLRREFVNLRIRTEEVQQERLQLEYAAERDALTELLSSRIFPERLNALTHQSRRFALLYLDVDRLKELNDRLGHSAGDMLLRSFAHDVADALPNTGMAFRKGGDEFLVLLPNAGRQEVETYLQDLFARLAIQRRIGEEAMTLSCSVGIALWPFDTQYAEQLEWMADQAMYQAKSSGKNQWAWHALVGQG